MRLILVEETDLEEAVSLLKSMTSAARRLLAECVEHQELSRKKASAAALALEDAGFIRIRGGGLFDEAIQLLPSLAGEEALEELDNQLHARSTMSVE